MVSISTDRSESIKPFNSIVETFDKVLSVDEISIVHAPDRLAIEQHRQLEQYQQQFQSQAQQMQLQQEQLNHLSDLLSQSDRQIERKPSWNHRKTWQRLRQNIASLQGGSAYQPRFSMEQIMLSYIGSFLGIAALAYISVGTSYPLIAAPFGAAAVLVFAVPSSPLAQPRNLILGNSIGAVVGIIMVHLFGSEPWVMALAVATAIKLMQITRTLHPPGGAVALVGVMSHAQWAFLFTPVLTGSIVLLLCTWIFNNLMPGRSYPKHWF